MGRFEWKSWWRKLQRCEDVTWGPEFKTLLSCLHEVLTTFLVQFLLQLYWLIELEFVVLEQTHQHSINVETMLVVIFSQCCFNVNIQLKMTIKPTYDYQYWSHIDLITLFYRWWTNVGSTLIFASYCMSINVILTLT